MKLSDKTWDLILTTIGVLCAVGIIGLHIYGFLWSYG